MRLNKDSETSIRRTLSRLLVTAAMPLAIWGCDSGTGALDSNVPTLPADVGLSGVIAIRHTDGDNIAEYVYDLVEDIDDAGNLNLYSNFPLVNTLSDLSDPDSPDINDDVLVADGLEYNVVVKWLDPLTNDNSITAPRFGATADYIAFIGDGVDTAAGDNPIFRGDSDAGWMWVNHEYVSGAFPTTSRVATSSNLVLANWLNAWNLFSAATFQALADGKAWATATDRDIFIQQHKRQLGGSWMRVVLGTDGWTVDRTATNTRFDATSNTQFRVTGYSVSARAKDDGGNTLPKQVVPGTLANCSGGLTPWGTIFTAEENSQDWYGDAEPWSSSEKFTSGKGFDVPNDIAPVWTASSSANYGQLSIANGKNNIDYYGFLVEIDPGKAPNEFYKPTADDDDDDTVEGDGTGHRKMGSFGRARWENMTVATDDEFNLVNGQPIVIYAADDRVNGRIYKWVSDSNYTSGMSRAEIRALLDSGKVYVAHFNAAAWAGGTNGCKRLDVATGFKIIGDNTAGSADGCGGSDAAAFTPTKAQRGAGEWILLDVNNTTQNAPASRQNTGGDSGRGIAAGGTTKVGAALKSKTFNLIGGFPKNNNVLSSLHTAATKLGITQLNRPEDLEYNPNPWDNASPLIYVAFTKHTTRYALDATGKIITGTSQDLLSSRTDTPGRIWAMEEAGGSPTATTFTYWEVWAGTNGTGRYDVGNPDNILIDANGGVWFGTDGNFGLTGQQAPDAYYYLDTDSSHSTTYGKAFRIASAPSDAEATGPAFTPDMTTFFASIQHPGEDIASSWPPVELSPR